MNKNNYSSINGLRTIGALSIVSVHVLKFLYKPPFEGVFRYLSIGEWAVELFFMISAFAMCCGYYEKIKNNCISFNDFYVKRYKRTLPFWAFMLLIGFLSAPNIDNIVQLFIELPLTFNLCFYPHLTLLQVGWFLGMIFTFYIIFPFFVFMMWTRKRAWISLVITIALSLVSQYYYSKVGSGWNDFQTVGLSIILFSPRFVLGGILYLYKDRIASFFHKTAEGRKCVCRLMFVILIVLAFFIMSVKSLILNAFNILLLLYAISFTNYPILDNAITKKISNLSMEIYLSHMLVFRALEMLHLTHRIQNYTLNYITILTTVFIGAFCFSYVVKYYVLPLIMSLPSRIISREKL